MNLQEARESKFQRFNYLSTEAKEGQAKAIEYVENLSAQASVNIAAWNLLEVFGDGKTLNVDRNVLNKAFFEQAEKNRAETPEALMTLPTEAVEYLERLIVNLKQDKITKLKNRVKDGLIQCSSMNDRIVENLCSIAGYRREIEVLSGQKMPLLEELQAISRSSFWEFVSICNQDVTYKTRADIILSYKHERSGRDLRVNFGILKAQINIVDGTLNVFKHDKCVEVSRYYHPHVDRLGQVCMGNVADEFYKCLGEQRYSRAMELLAAVLINYNPDSPYVALEEYQSAYPDHAPVGVKVVPASKCEGCGKINRDCSCCGICGEDRDSCGCCHNCEMQDCECCSECDRHTDNCVCERDENGDLI